MPTVILPDAYLSGQSAVPENPNRCGCIVKIKEVYTEQPDGLSAEQIKNWKKYDRGPALTQQAILCGKYINVKNDWCYKCRYNYDRREKRHQEKKYNVESFT